MFHSMAPRTDPHSTKASTGKLTELDQFTVTHSLLSLNGKKGAVSL